MNDSHTGMRANPASFEPKSAAAAEHTREQTHRRAYVSMRLEEIGMDIAAKVDERERLTASLKGPATKDGPALKQLRRRRTYVAERLAILRNEQAELNAERKALGSAGSSAGNQSSGSRN